MKKFGLLGFFLVCLLITGCGKDSESTILKKLDKKINNNNSYLMTGTLEVLNNDDIYNYEVETAYKKDNYYKVTLKNTANDHEQIILKNDDGVYVLTPSLNKSFKFQSDWPYNNSQIYLLESLINDIKNDNKSEFKTKSDGYIFTSKVNYPNNRNLVRQKVSLDKKVNLKKVVVLDSDSVPNMTLNIKKIDYNPHFSKNYFNLDDIMGSSSSKDTKTEKTGIINDVIYPLFLPEGTKLTNEETIKKDDGNRVILTFSGEKPFTLVEEVDMVNDQFTVIPTMGEPFMIMDSLGVLGDNSVNFSSNGISYYLVSDVMNQSELLEIANSINVLPTMK